VSNRTTQIGLSAGIGTPASYRLIRSGIPAGRFHPDGARRALLRRGLGIADDETVVGSVGRLSEQKNPLDFVAVASRLLAGRSGLRFLYVGDGPLRDVVEHEIGARDLAERVSLLGVRHDVPDLLRALDVFVLTSLWEGLPRVVLQALATGVPVVAYDTAGIEEAVADGANGYLVRPGAVETMVERLAHLIDDPSARAAMAARARDGISDEFTEDRMIRDLEALYDELTRGRSLGP
jgi:glycosyltransferase involved in cell wall biosynthesis